MFTVVIPYRPRPKYDSYPDLVAVIRSIQSYVPVVVSWYGKPDFSEINMLCDDFSNTNVKLTETDALFNRSRAINIGAKAAFSHNIFVNDADCMWERDISNDLKEAFKKGHFVYRIKFNGEINLHGAGMQGYDKTKIQWDERFEGYGREDIDMLRRAGKYSELSGGITHLDHPINQQGWEDNKKRYSEKWK